MPRIALAITFAIAFVAAAHAQQPVWIWSPDNARRAEPLGACYARHMFEMGEPESGDVEITADDSYRLYVNGRVVGQGANPKQLTRYEITNLLAKGRNVIAIEANNAGGPAAMLARVTVKDKGGSPVQQSTGGKWRTSLKLADGWQAIDFKDDDWKPAHTFGSLGVTAPWGNVPLAETSIAAPKPLPAVKRPSGKFQFVEGDRVVLLGDTFIEREGRYGYVETTLTRLHPTLNLTFRNLGWSGDNVFARSRAGFDTEREGFQRLKDHLRTLQPTVVLLAYGNNESYAGDAGLAAFVKGMETLLAVLDELKATVVFFTPLKQENLGPPLPDPTEFNKYRKRYGDAVQAMAAKRGAAIVDLYEVVEKHGRTYAVIDGVAQYKGMRLTENGVNLSEFGYWFVANAIAERLGIDQQYSSFSLAWDAGQKRFALKNVRHAIVEEVQGDRSRATFSLTMARLPATPCPPTGFGSMPVPSGYFRVDGLEPRKYEVIADGKSVGREVASFLEQIGFLWHNVPGMALPYDYKPPATPRGPVYFDDRVEDIEPPKPNASEVYRPHPNPDLAQSEALRRAIREKNQLYFHRWRPQNSTYLFLFRKHEQGNNAVEIPQFDPLVAEKEKEIAQVRMPRKHVYEVRPATK